MLLRRAITSIGLAIVVSSTVAAAAMAGLTRTEIAAAGFHLTPGTALPASAPLRGTAGDTTLGAVLAGKPALVTFTDYKCQSMCGVVLDELSDTLPKVPLTLGRDYNVVSLALDSDQTVADALAFRDQHTRGSTLHDDGRFFANDAAALQRIEASVGLVAPYDAQHKQFAHPVGLVLVDAQGKAERIVSPFALNPLDLKLALTESGAPTSLSGHALSLCYAFDPVTGLYTLRIQRVLAFAAATTIVLMVGAVSFLLWIERRSRRLAERTI